MKRVLGIFRGFPGLGRVVAGVSILETLRDQYNYEIKMISYLQGNEYLKLRGYADLFEVTQMDYCSIGLLPTNKMGVHIHNTIKLFNPEIIVIDGEPLLLQSIKISYPHIKIVVLLNPADVENRRNDKEAMDYFNALYSLSDLAIVHGLRLIDKDCRYKNMISIKTILRPEILKIRNSPSNNIYCVLGGGTVNVDKQFETSTLKIANLCKDIARCIPQYNMHIICSSHNIYKVLMNENASANLFLYDKIIPSHEYYSKACLVITRSGRNTLSELAYLGIPSISFITGDKYRSFEQTQNANELNGSIKILTEEVSCNEFKEIIVGTIVPKANQSTFVPGNQVCINKILSLE